MGVADDLKRRLEIEIKALTAKINEPGNVRIIADEATRRIVTRTRLGYGVPGPEQTRQKLSPLKESTVKARKKKTLSPNTSPKRSNLTDTGKMLDSITWRIIGRDTIRIAPSGGRDDGENNADVAGYAHDGSSNRAKRPFLFLSDAETKGLSRFIRELLVKKLNR